MKNFIAYMAGARPLFWLLPCLMILLVAGTVAQKNLGIYDVQQQYFGAVVSWIGPIPFPGGLTLMSLFALNLILKFILKSDWSWTRAGTNISHFGVIVLVIGGLLTALTAREGYLVLGEGETKAAIEDYHQRELVIRTDDKILLRLPHEHIRADMTVGNNEIPFKLHINTYCYNCAITRRAENEQDGWTSPGKFMQLNPTASDKQDEKNLTGVEFTVSSAGEQDGKYLTFDKFPKPPVIKVDGTSYTIAIEREARPLPFSMTLKKFILPVHPGSSMARDYISELTVTENGQEWPVRIAMNEPFRYKGYTFYQSSFDQGGDVPVTVLSVVKNEGRIFPYLASGLIAFGLIWHLASRLRRRSLILILCSLLLTPAAQAETLNTAQFGQLPVLQDGRLKPIDSFARVELKKFSGKETWGNKSAAEWLAATLFDPSSATGDAVFFVPDVNTRHALALPERAKPFYSLEELAPGLQRTAAKAQEFMGITSDALSEDQKNLLRVHENALEYTEILRSFSAVLPLNLDVPPAWRKQANLGDDTLVTYWNLQKITPALEDDIKKLIRKKGENIGRYTESEQKLALLGLQIRTLSEAGVNNKLLRIIPVTWNAQPDWVTPWQLLQEGKGSPETGRVLTLWQRAALAWQAGDNAAWEATLADIDDYNANAQAIEAISSALRLSLEYWYSTVSPFDWALGLYVTAFLLALTQMAYPYRRLPTLAMAAVVTALAMQAGGLGARIAILARPPVGTLYESLLFVGLVAPFVAILLRRLGTLRVLMAGLSGAALNLLALSLAGDEDTLHVLTAVLNTQFWLATHVLCITIGYGWCVVTALLAHVILIGRVMHRLTPDLQKNGVRALGLLALFALLFTAVGTILGGIWADQSWGRFWGWDPKENGALLIVLWLAWTIHGKISGHLTTLTWTMSLSFLSFIVALAWIGVNLLGVGLHSYGFMEGVFWGLGAFGMLELALIGGLGFYNRKYHART